MNLVRAHHLMIVLMVLGSGPAKAQATLTWLDLTADAKAVATIAGALAAELKVGVPGAHPSPIDDMPPELRRDMLEEMDDDDAPPAPALGWSIARVGVYGDFRLVLLGSGPSQAGGQGDGGFRALTLDLRTMKATAVASDDRFYDWELLAVARMEPRGAPDVLFTYSDCTDCCEAQRMLASFQWEEASGTWRLRRWHESETALFVGGDFQFDDEDYRHLDCAYVTKDLTGDGLWDVAIRCPRELQEGKDGITVWSVSKDKTTNSFVPAAEKKRFKKLLKLFCKGESTSKCALRR